jgi:predicted TIM-barrel fold metal-dependent hydrolase
VLDLPIIDAHQHFWDPPSTPHPWLSTAPLPDFRYGDYAALRRPYLPADFRADAKGHNIVATVHMEAEWDTSDEVGETRWLATLRAAHGLPTVAIGHARFEDPGVEEVLAGHAGFDFIRGVRQKPTAAPAPFGARRGAAGSMDDPRWRRGYALLERHGFSYDLQTPWWHLDAAADLAHAFRRTTIIVNHTGLPSDRSLDGLKAWRQMLERVAREPNVALKISGLGQRAPIPGRATPIARSYKTRSPSSAPTAACSPATTRWTACAWATGRCSTTSSASWPIGRRLNGSLSSTTTPRGSTGSLLETAEADPRCGIAAHRGAD